MEEKQVKASELLISIESKMDKTLEYCQNFHFTNQLILSLVQKLSQDLEKLKSPEPKPAIKTQLPPPGSPEAKAILGSDIEFHDVEAPRRTQRNNERRIPVEQKLVYVYTEGERNVHGANVEVLSVDGNLINRPKMTNALGKVLLDLVPGQYIFRIKKAGSTLKPAINMEYPVLIPDQTKPVTLDIIKIQTGISEKS